jgi:hypothetical protein
MKPIAATLVASGQGLIEVKIPSHSAENIDNTIPVIDPLL